MTENVRNLLKLIEENPDLPAELMKIYDEHIEANRKWRDEIQQKVDELYKADKKISLLWTPTCKRGKCE